MLDFDSKKNNQENQAENQENLTDQNNANDSGNNNNSQANNQTASKNTFTNRLTVAKANPAVKWAISAIVLALLLYFSISSNFSQMFSDKKDSLPDCNSQDNIALLQQTLSEHPDWVQNVYGFNPSKQYSINGVYIYKNGDKTLKKSFCKASVVVTGDNSKKNIIDVYYVLQDSISGNNTEIEVLNPFSL